MNRAAKTKINIVVSLVHQLVTAISGLVLPRLILDCFGSETNGLLQAINQILSYMVLFEFGIGGVVRASLYKPLAENDMHAVSDIFNNTKKFFRKISFVFIGFAFCLCFSAGFIISVKFDFEFVAGLVLILAVHTFFGYYFAMPEQILIKSDQRLYVIQTIQIVAIIINIVVCFLAMNVGCSIHVVKIFSVLVFLINPISYKIYVAKKYKINKNIYCEGRILPRKTDGMIHHIAYFIHENTDIVILSIVCGASTVSVYSVYNSVIIMVRTLLNSVSGGISAAIGNMIAKKEQKALEKAFNKYVAVNTAVIGAFITVCVIMIIPFVRIYTDAVTDISYIEPVFAFLMCGSAFMYCVRIPYVTVINSAGHYRETKPGAIVEVILNLVISLILVKQFGLVGVATGTLAGMTFRTFYSVWYLSKNILRKPVSDFLISLVLNIVPASVFIVTFSYVTHYVPVDFIGFMVKALKISAFVFPAFAICNIASYCIKNKYTR